VGVFVVTGGAGFIGGHLVDALLAEGHRVRVLDDFSTGRRESLDPRVELLAADAVDAQALRTALTGADGCYHLAAIASVARGNADWPGTHRVNQGAAVAVFDTARAAGGVPVVYASSAAVYGDLGDVAARETDAAAPLTAYGADKRGCELHGRVAWGVHGVPTLGLRFFNVYGPRQDPASPYSGVVSVFAARLARGETLGMHGDGRQTRDFVFVADAVAHLRAAMARLRGRRGAEVLNVCSGRAVSVLDLAALIGRLMGCVPRLEHGPARPGDIRHSRGDPAAAVAALGLAAATPLEEGLAATLRWTLDARAAVR